MSFNNRSLIPALLVSFALASGCRDTAAPRSPAAGDSEGFTSLFNGKDFTGWEGNLEFFRIQDGAIVAGRLNERIPRNEFLCTRKDYSDFELRLQIRVSSDQANGGIQIRSRRVPDHNEVSGYQADVGMIATSTMLGNERFVSQTIVQEAGIGGQPRTNLWGTLYDESRRNRMLDVGNQEQVNGVYKPNEWNDYRIRCQGKRIRIWVNDYQTVDYEESEDGIEATGLIGLQVHSGPPTEVWYRNLRIKELQPSTTE